MRLAKDLQRLPGQWAPCSTTRAIEPVARQKIGRPIAVLVHPIAHFDVDNSRAASVLPLSGNLEVNDARRAAIARGWLALRIDSAVIDPGHEA